MKLTKNCKMILDTVIAIEPNSGIRFYTNDYVFRSLPDSSLTEETFVGLLDELEELKAIKWADAQHTGFSMTGIGLEYKEIDRLEKAERWKERIFGFVSGILVTVLATLIIGWFAQSPAQQDTQPQTTGAPSSLSLDRYST